MTTKVKIGKDDVVILDESKLPKIVTPQKNYGSDHDFSEGKQYEVIGITWDLYPDRTRSLCYILKGNRNNIVLHRTDHFEVVS